MAKEVAKYVAKEPESPSEKGGQGLIIQPQGYSARCNEKETVSGEEVMTEGDIFY